jgi:hypothetical protein
VNLKPRIGALVFDIFLCFVIAVITAILMASVLGFKYTDTPMVMCAWCHELKSEVDLERHHPKPQHAFPELANDNIKNPVIVFCKRCHLVMGHKGNFRTYNPDVLEIVTKYTNSLPNEPESER